MDIRLAYSYAKPTTLIAIIVDAVEALHPTAGEWSNSYIAVKRIVSTAWTELEANVGMEDAIEMAADAGLTPDSLERFIY